MTSRTKRILVAATALPSLAAFFWMRSSASWRPVKIGKTSTHKGPVGFLSQDGKVGLSFVYHGDEEDEYGDEITDFESGRTTPWPDKNAILGFSKTVPELAFLADGEAGKVKVREVRTAKLKQTLIWVRGIFEPRFVKTSNASTVALVGNNTFFLWDINSGKQLRRVPLKNLLPGGDEGLYALSSDGTRLAGCSSERGTIWNAQSGQVLRSWTIKGNAEFISSGGRVLVYNSGGGYLFVDCSTGKVLWQKQRNQLKETGGFYPWLTDDDEVIFTTSKECNVFDLFTGHLKRQLAGPRDIDGNLVRITPDYIYSVHASSATMNSNGEIWRWRAR